MSSDPIRAAAALSFAAACIHASVIIGHFREYVLFGLFFAIVTPLQIAWAGLAVSAPGDRRLLTTGALLNGGIALTWLMSRTVGLPFGPERLEAESAGVKDVLATSAELMIVGLVAAPRGKAPVWAVNAGWALAAAGMVGALVGGSH